MLDTALRYLLRSAAMLWTGARAVPPPSSDLSGGRLYFANHVSHGDFVLVWAVLDAASRERTRPVAAADYWNADPIRRFIGQRIVRALLIERDKAKRVQDPVSEMVSALERGESLILFPEGTRNLTDAPLLPFKSGLYHVHAARPQTTLIPVWVDNLHRVLPKGELLPVPLLCTVHFGAPLEPVNGEDKAAFLERAQAALLALKGDDR
jgi:1-acyl-sn-glycerol-3-phosphate acyltransferase